MWIKKNVIFVMLMMLTSYSFATTLQEKYDNATSQNGYDKYIILEEGVTYTGGLLILGDDYGMAADVKIEGNGAILDLEGGVLKIEACDNKLDVSNCVVINGHIRYYGDLDDNYEYFHQPYGSVTCVTFYKPLMYAVRLQGVGGTEGTNAIGGQVLIKKNIFFEAQDMGPDLHPVTGEPLESLPTGINCAFSLFPNLYGTADIIDNWSYTTLSRGDHDFRKLWETGWTLPVSWEEAGSAPNNNIMQQDPMLTDPENGDYSLASGSPAVGYGVGNVLGINDQNSIHKSFELDQNYPNPFNPSTTIVFNLKNSNSEVKLTILNSTGAKIYSSKINNPVSGYNNVKFDGSALNSGIYYYTLEVDGISDTRKMILIK